MTADQLFMVHRRLGNQMPCRYYLDAKGDGSYSHVCLECYFPNPGFATATDNGLAKELEALGMQRQCDTGESWPTPDNQRQGPFLVRRYVAERSKTEQGGYI